MIALKDKVIVKCHLDQKETLTYGSLKLAIPFRHQLQENGRIGNPTLCEVISSSTPLLKEGDAIIVGHNSVSNMAWRIQEEDGVRIMSLPVDRWILGKLGTKGELIPLFENTVCKRMFQPDASSIIITPDAFKKTEENKVIVLAVAPGVTDLHEGDTGIVYKHSDYEIFWSVEGQEKSAVIVWEKEIVARQNTNDFLN